MAAAEAQGLPASRRSGSACADGRLPAAVHRRGAARPNKRGSVRALPGCGGRLHGDPHLCCADGERAPSHWGMAGEESTESPFGSRPGHAGGPGRLQEAEPTPCPGSLSSLRGLRVSGSGKCVLWQQSAGPRLRLDWCVKWGSPSRAAFLWSAGHYFYMTYFWPNTSRKTLDSTMHLRPNSALSQCHCEDKDGPWVKSKIWITQL